MISGIEALRKEAERQILARIFNEPKEYALHSKKMHEGMFFDGLHRKIFNSFIKILESGKKADLI
jgi:replicative DNA helicase